MTSVPLHVTLQVLDVLEELGVPYVLVGSLATSAVGVPRSTIDSDVVADLRREHIPPLVAALQEAFYVSETAALQAVERKSMFNLIHLATSFKVDIYVLGDRDFDREEFRRRTPRAVAPEDPRAVPMATPEDLVLSKLEWYQLGNQVSERQWRDLQGVLATCSGKLDWAYLERWAERLDVRELLERARREASLEE